MDQAKIRGSTSTPLNGFGEKVAQAAREGVFFHVYTYNDKTLTCADCGQQFAFSASEQQFYADRQFSEPRRCPSCRALRKASRGDSGGGSRSYSDAGSGGYGGYGGGGGGGGYGGQREMFTATCANCGKEAQVPFRPSGAKPVYCSDCFADRR